MKEKTIQVPIYGHKFTIILFDDWSEIRLRFPSKEEFSYVDCDGGVFLVDDRAYLVLQVYNDEGVQYPTPGIIAHESKHLVNRIFQDIRQELDLYNDEAECYLLGYIVNRVHEFVNKTKYIKHEKGSKKSDK